MGEARVRTITGILFSAMILSASLFGESAFAAGNAKAGRVKYRQLCSVCHGQSGKGDGAAAKGFPVKPADHTKKSQMSRLTNKYLETIITKGGRSVGKSPLMPPFGNLLKPADVRNLIAYIRSLAR